MEIDYKLSFKSIYIYTHLTRVVMIVCSEVD